MRAANSPPGLSRFVRSSPDSRRRRRQPGPADPIRGRGLALARRLAQARWLHAATAGQDLPRRPPPASLPPVRAPTDGMYTANERSPPQLPAACGSPCDRRPTPVPRPSESACRPRRAAGCASPPRCVLRTRHAFPGKDRPPCRPSRTARYARSRTRSGAPSAPKRMQSPDAASNRPSAGHTPVRDPWDPSPFRAGCTTRSHASRSPRRRGSSSTVPLRPAFRCRRRSKGPSR